MQESSNLFTTLLSHLREFLVAPVEYSPAHGNGVSTLVLDRDSSGFGVPGHIIAEVHSNEIRISTGAELMSVEVYYNARVCAQRIFYLYDFNQDVNPAIGLALRRVRDAHTRAHERHKDGFAAPAHPVKAASSQPSAQAVMAASSRSKIETGFKHVTVADIHSHLGACGLGVEIYPVHPDARDLPSPWSGRLYSSTQFGTWLRVFRGSRRQSDNGGPISQSKMSRIENGEIKCRFDDLRICLHRSEYGVGINWTDDQTRLRGNVYFEGLASSPWAAIYNIAEEHVGKALMTIHSTIDGLLRDGRFSRCDEIMKNVELERLDSTAIVGLLMATHPAKSKLKEYSNFLTKSRARLDTICPDRAERLTKGLS